ncbi:MAG TPA: (d)CMP kinase [Candidatus Limnocylindrales bacterium]
MPSRTNQTRRVIVALDGPASSGKSSVGAAAAEQLQLRFVDTGLFYRAVTALALLEGVPLDDPAALVPLVSRVTLGDDGTGRLTRVLLDGMDATEEARSATVDGYVSAVARVREVREALLERQRELADAGGIVVAGRDIGTVVLPDADLKIFLDASVEERAKRRIAERGLDPDGDEAEDVREQLRVRDAIDAGREVAPLRAADDAVHVVTDGNVFDDTVEIVAAEIARVMLTPRKATRSRTKTSPSRTAAAAAAAGEALGTAEPEPTAETGRATETEPTIEDGPEPAVAEPMAIEAEPAALPSVSVEIEPGPFAVTATAGDAATVHPVLGPFASASDVTVEDPAAAVAEPAPADVAPGPFAVDTSPSSDTIANPVAGAFAVSSAVSVELPRVAEPVPVDPGPFSLTALVEPASAANPVAGPFAVASTVEVVLPEVAPPPGPVDPGPFAADAPAGTSPHNPVAGPFAVAHDVLVELPVLPAPAPVDRGPFTMTALVVDRGIGHPVAGPFAVASDVEVELHPVAPEPTPVDPGPFSVAASGLVEPLGNPVVGPFALASDVEVELPPVAPEPAPAPVDPGHFGVAASGLAEAIANPVTGPFAVSSEVTVERAVLPEPMSIDHGPFAVDSLALVEPLANPVAGPFAAAPDVEVVLPAVAPEPEPVHPGPFAVDAPALAIGPGHAVAGPFAVSDSVDVVLPAPEPLEIDDGPFGVTSVAGGAPIAHAALGSFAVSSDVAHELRAVPGPEPEAEQAPAPEQAPDTEPAPEAASSLEATPESAPEPGPEPAPASQPIAAQPPSTDSPARGRTRSTILETAMRLDNDQSTLVRMVALVSRIGARAVANVQVDGLDNIPRTGAVILAVNHISNADAIVSGAWISESLKRRRIHWLGKKELFDWPAFGWIAANGGVHPVDRDSADIEAFRLATRILEKGYVLLVFPEGTRSPTGELQVAKDGVAMLALRTGAQVVPVGISNTDAVWKKGQLLPMPFPRRTVHVRIGEPFRVQDVIPEGADRRTAKTLATTAIMGRIAELLDPRHRGVYAGAIREGRHPER